MSKLALRAQTVDITDLPLRHDLLPKNVLMTAQRNFGLDNSPSTFSFSLQGKFPALFGSKGVREILSGLFHDVVDDVV